MRAVLLLEYGDDENLQFIKHHTAPVVEKDDDVLIKVKACALSDLDLQIRRGELKELVTTPAVIGYEIAGIVTEVGQEVKQLAVGDEVVGMAPLDIASGGYSEYIVLNQHMVVRKPLVVSHEDAAAAVAGGVRAYTAFHYLMNLVAGETVLILNGASAYGHIAIQVAGSLGFRILTTASTAEEMNYLNDLHTDIVRVIDTRNENLTEAVIEETGGLGVEGILEDAWGAGRGLEPLGSGIGAGAGARDEDESDGDESDEDEGSDGAGDEADGGDAQKRKAGKKASSGDGDDARDDGADGGSKDGDASKKDGAGRAKTSKSWSSVAGGRASVAASSAAADAVRNTQNDLIRCLAVHGRWVTSYPNLQMDAGDSRLLMFKGATLSFLFEQSWILSGTQHGRYLHVMTDLVDKLANGEIRPRIARTFPLEQIRKAHRELEVSTVGAVVIKP